MNTSSIFGLSGLSRKDARTCEWAALVTNERSLVLILHKPLEFRFVRTRNEVLEVLSHHFLVSEF
ncbi:MAG: hypothetical protein ACI83W_002164 [Marinoscillum sp.]|jgi:hypothetical protein